MTKEELESQIWDLGFRNYDTFMRRKHNADQHRKSQLRLEQQMNKTDEQYCSELIEKLKEEELQKAEQIAKEKEEAEKKAREEEERKRRMKKHVDEYTVCLETVKFVSGPLDQDIMVHVERVVEKEPFEDISVLRVPWNKLSTKNEIEVIFSIVKNGVEIREPVLINVMKHVVTFPLQKIAKMEIKAVVSI